GAAEQRRLAGAGAGDQVDREDAEAGQPLAVGGGMGVVVAEDVALDAEGAGAVEARDGETIAVAVPVVMGVPVGVVVGVPVLMIVRVAAAAHRAHSLDLQLLDAQFLAAGDREAMAAAARAGIVAPGDGHRLGAVGAA